MHEDYVEIVIKQNIYHSYIMRVFNMKSDTYDYNFVISHEPVKHKNEKLR